MSRQAIAAGFCRSTFIACHRKRRRHLALGRGRHRARHRGLGHRQLSRRWRRTVAHAQGSPRAMLTLTLVIGILVSLRSRSSPASRRERSSRRAISRSCSISRKALLGVLLAVVGTHVIVSLLAPWLSLYGTRRLAVSILVGLRPRDRAWICARRIRLGNADLGRLGLCRPGPDCASMVPSRFSADGDWAVDRGSAHPRAGADDRRRPAHESGTEHRRATRPWRPTWRRRAYRGGR